VNLVWEIGIAALYPFPNLGQPKIRPMPRNKMNMGAMLPMIAALGVVSLIKIEQIPEGMIRRVEKVRRKLPPVLENLRDLVHGLTGRFPKRAYAICPDGS
jgi:hypothetical protein